MKKNLILAVGLVLVLVMIVSVSALPSWLTGKATDANFVSIKVNKGETKTFSLGEDLHEISIVFMNDASTVVLSVDGANTGGIIKGATYESGNLKVKVLTIRYSNNWFSKSKYVTLEVSKVESEEKKSSCEGNVCTLYEGDKIQGVSNGVTYNFTLEVIREGHEYLNNLVFVTDKGFGGSGTMETIGLDQTWGDQTTGKQTRIIYSLIEEGKVTFNFYYEDYTPTPTGEVTYQGVLDMFKNAKKEGRIQLGLSQIEGNVITRTNGYEICGDYKTCLFGFAILDIPTQNFLKASDITLIECSRYVDLKDSIGDANWVDGTKVYLDYMCVPQDWQ